jgi:hypothetical protein
MLDAEARSRPRDRSQLSGDRHCTRHAWRLRLCCPRLRRASPRSRELRTGPLLHAAARFELVGNHPNSNQDLGRTPVA